LIHGLVVAFTVPTAIEYIKMVTPDNLSATAIAFAGLCSSILLSIVVFVSGFIIDYLGLGMIYYFFAILALINVLITIRTENEKTTNK
jgi:MFS family permease